MGSARESQKRNRTRGNRRASWWARRVQLSRLQCFVPLVCRPCLVRLTCQWLWMGTTTVLPVSLRSRTASTSLRLSSHFPQYVPSPFFPLRLIPLPSLCSRPLFVIDHTDQNLALLSSLGGIWRLRDPSPTFLRRCSSTSPPASRPRLRTPWTISVTSGALALS